MGKKELKLHTTRCNWPCRAIASTHGNYTKRCVALLYYPMNFEIVKQLILDFETNKMSVEKAVEEINKVSVKSVDEEWLKSYWNAIDLDEFVDLLTLPQLDNWKDLNDDESITLIEEAISNITRNAVFQRNSEALERRYSKPEGTVSNWVYHEDIVDPKIILKKLKQNTTIIL